MPFVLAGHIQSVFLVGRETPLLVCVGEKLRGNHHSGDRLTLSTPYCPFDC